jgi:uncharacterized membrane protein (DUF2068 family)
VTIAPGTQRPRRRRQLDWELITCGVKGHALVGRDAGPAREQDALVVRDDGDVRWHRCLRCDCWMALPIPRGPVREHPPDRSQIAVPLRGKALRDQIVLRVIAVDRVLHFLILGLLGVAVLAFAANRATLHDSFYRVLTALQGGMAGAPVQTSGHVGIVHDLDRLFSYRTGTLREVGVALLAYAALEGVEAVGLWLGRRWAEYLTFVATSILLPLEIYEIIHGGTVLKVIGFSINLAVVVYLLFKKRLFGLRGGGGAEASQRAREMSWEHIERTTPKAPTALTALTAPTAPTPPTAPATPAPLAPETAAATAPGSEAAS